MRTQHGNTGLYYSAVFLSSLRMGFIDEELVEVFGGARTRWFHRFQLGIKAKSHAQSAP